MTSFLEQAEMKGIERGIEQGIERGRAEERQVIRERLIAGGIAPQDAARFVGLAV